MQIAQVVVDVANTSGCSASQVALAWIRHQSPRHIPIIGARNLAHLQDNLGCLNVTLSGDQLTRLNAINQSDPGFALRFLRKLQNMFLGAATETLDLSLHPTIAYCARSQMIQNASDNRVLCSIANDSERALCCRLVVPPSLADTH